MPDFVVMDEIEFEQRYLPLLDSNGSWREFWPDVPEVVELLAVATEERRIWTMLDVDGFTMLSSGRHFVNRLGYYVSAVPVPINQDVSVYDDEEYAEWEELLLKQE